ncbi:DUF2971 domain-containing protein [Providencia sp. PROV216]|uniref:DUF2971 domain-containing protein n=1 Tax=Providencia sp. PROV216 TaxID=2949912 RepID=UPI00234B223F|nr:DUF2971 domain-containing protein [Providencia sp. PROV216]
MINEKNVLHINDIDIPIYRIFSIERFKEMIKTNELGLVRPSMWEDPYENFFLKTQVDFGNGDLASLEEIEKTWYGQCWTQNEDTDAMWRIYSREKDGIRVKTTVRKLFSAIYDNSAAFPDLQFFIGKVQYKTKQEIIQLIETITFTDVYLGGQNDKFAKLLCIKRDSFEHENEIRILINEPDSTTELDKIYKVSIKPEDLFDEICLDPRLFKNDFLNLKADIELMGVKTKIIQSDLYKLDIPMIIKAI